MHLNQEERKISLRKMKTQRQQKYRLLKKFIPQLPIILQPKPYKLFYGDRIERNIIHLVCKLDANETFVSIARKPAADRLAINFNSVRKLSSLELTAEVNCI